MPTAGYTSSVIPIILAVWIAAKLEKYFRQHFSEYIKFFFVPTCTLAIMPGDMPLIAAGLPLRTWSSVSLGARESQSIRFFRTPGKKWLYSGVKNQIPSAASTLSRTYLTGSGAGNSMSWFMAGIPIRSTPGVGGGFEIMRQYKVDRRVFSSADLSAILMGLSGLSDMMRGDELAGALAKVKSLVPADKAKDIELKVGQIHIDLSPWMGNENIRPYFEIVKTALQEGRLLSFEYVDHHEGVEDSGKCALVFGLEGKKV